MRALDHLINFIFVVPELRHIFFTEGALKVLEELVKSLETEIEQHVDTNEYLMLLSWSRRALLSVQDSGINNAAKEFIYACEAPSRIKYREGMRRGNHWFDLGCNFANKVVAAIGRRCVYLHSIN